MIDLICDVGNYTDSRDTALLSYAQNKEPRYKAEMENEIRHLTLEREKKIEKLSALVKSFTEKELATIRGYSQKAEFAEQLRGLMIKVKW